MKKNFFIFLGIFAALASSRFIPHPPNFTSIIALSFYVPALLGLRYLPFLILSFVITDIFIGYHNLTFWTWGSIILIGLISRYFTNNIIKRLGGALIGSFIFFLITNLGVWFSGMYGHTIAGLITCFTLAVPFFAYSIISTFLFSSIIEAFYNSKIFVKFSKIKKYY